ncbi:histidine phosphatase family protein [Aquincola sp. S2]|uniref:Histidine phosphatase family protein n=1 Tax=Pseudaquabacterium terrae TaxID=2732868 RepID=A0ABX2EH55_9BURK|nr:histidine phosphatase family protein [Aquabacterium terrae]NRF67954.1 histidine phosphatase family protein [Aquabacterium terrae]
MTLLLIRHGETAHNAGRVLQPADTPLSTRGVAQARALGRRLAGAGIAGIVTSNLPRARQTACAIAKACGLPLTELPQLQERNYGVLRGRRYDELGFDPLVMEEAPPGGESARAFEARAAAAFDTLLPLRRSVGGPLAVVTHGLLLRAWLQRGPLQLENGQALPTGIANASITIVAARPPHRVLRINDTEHLDDDMRGSQRTLAGG